MSAAALALEGVEVTYRRPGALFGSQPLVRALGGVDLVVAPGECVGVVGESGSGKSTIAQVAVGLLKPDRGRVILGDRAMPPEPRNRAREMRRYLQLVPQNPYGSLDPMLSVAEIVAEGLAIHRLCPPGERRERASAALAEVGLAPALLDRRPHALSGGQRQRVAIARALAVEPTVLVLDEPTSALDLMVQAQVLNLLLDLQQRRNLAFLLISHDIDVVRHLAHRVYVIRHGAIVEHGPTLDVLSNPSHAYTRALIDAVPVIEAHP